MDLIFVWHLISLGLSELSKINNHKSLFEVVDILGTDSTIDVDRAFGVPFTPQIVSLEYLKADIKNLEQTWTPSNKNARLS